MTKMETKELKIRSVWQITNDSFSLLFINLRNIVKIYIIIVGITIVILTGLGFIFYFLYKNQYDFELFFSSLSSFDDLIFYMQEKGLRLLITKAGVFYFLFSCIILIFTAPFQVMLYDVFIKSYLNERWKFSLSFLSAIKRIGSLSLSILIEKLLIAISFFIPGIGFIIIRIFSFFIVPSAIYEKKGLFISIGRSFKLSAKSFFKLLLTYIFFLLMVFVIILISIFLMYYITLVVLTVIFENILSHRMFIIGILSIAMPFLFLLLLGPLFTALRVILFFNQKIKKENFGVEFFIKKVFDISSLTYTKDNEQ